MRLGRSRVFTLAILTGAVGIYLDAAKTENGVARWASSGSMNTARSAACSALLPDGRVLVTGGRSGDFELNTAEFFNISGTFSPAPLMSVPRADHSCVALADGSVLVAGGTSGGGTTNSVELFNPITNSWSAIGAMTSARSGATLTQLLDGRVLFAGGEASGVALATIEVYDPATRQFLPVSDVLSAPRRDHAAAMLRDGRVLIAGGSDGKQTLDSVDIIDPLTLQVSSLGNMMSKRTGLSATTLLDGRVFFAGGSNGEADLASTEIFDPATRTFSPAAAMDTPRRGHVALRIPNNNSILIAGGSGSGVPVPNSGLYIPWRNTFEPMAALAEGRTDISASLLKSSGGVVLAGGSTRLAASSAYETTGLPTVMTDKLDYAPGEFVTITGANWATGATVALEVREVPGGTLRWSKSVTASATGTISDNTLQMQSSDLGKTFELTATEGGTGRTAQVWTFTDNVVDVDLTSPVSPVTYTSLPQTVTVSFTYSTSLTGTTTGLAEIFKGSTVVASASKSLTPGLAKSDLIMVTVPVGTPNDSYGVRVTVTNPIQPPGPTTRSDALNSIVVISVPANTPPTANAGGPYSVAEGSSVTLMGTGSDSDAGQTLSYSWDLDNNGSFEAPGQNVSFSAATIDGPASRTVVLRVCDNFSTPTCTNSSATVNITNVAPAATFNAPASVNEGSDINLSLTAPVDPAPADTFTYAFDCGSGYVPFSATNTAACPTTDNGTRMVKGKIRDDDGGETEYTASVTINNVVPTVNLTGPNLADEGQTKIYTFTVSDVAADTYSGVASCGTGGTLVGGSYSVSGNSGSQSGSFQCSFPDGPATPTVKIEFTDDDGGVGTHSVGVTVANVAPTVSFTTPTTPVNEGPAEVTYNFTITDPGVDTFSFVGTPSCGADGMLVASSHNITGSTGSFKCKFPDGPATTTLSVQVQDSDGAPSNTATTNVQVDNVAPTVSFATPTTPVNEGPAEVTYNFTITDPGVDTFSFVGTPSCGADGMLVASSSNITGSTGSFKCKFPDGPATTTLSVQVQDSDGANSNTATTNVQVNNVAPTVVLSGDATADEGQTKTYTFTVTDPGQDTFTVLDGFPDCGTGGNYVASSLSTNSGGGSFQCTFPDGPASPIVRMQVKDSDNDNSNIGTRSVTVVNVAPTATFNAPSPVNEGSNISLSLTSPSDPSSADTVAGFMYAFDCGTGSGYGAYTTMNSTTCPTTDNGVRNVTGKIKDKDNSEREYMASVTINNVAPAITSSLRSPASLNEGQSVSLQVFFTDPGTADTHTLMVDWGNGVTGTASIVSGGTVSYTYPDDHPATNTPSDILNISFKVVDDDGGQSASAGASVTVNNVAPTLSGTLSGPVAPIAKPASATVTATGATFTDPGTGTTETFKCYIRWDDGSPDEMVKDIGAGTRDCSGSYAHTFNAAGVYTVELYVKDDDTGESNKIAYQFVIVYDPSAGFVTGGGWIMSPGGAYRPDLSLTGKANFGFVSKYKKGANTPDGNTEFQFHAGNMNFKSSMYEWLVVAGARAQYKGMGTINGTGNYGFLLTAIDGQVNGGGGVDKFRIKIWDKNAGDTIVYDNAPGSDDIDSSSALALGGGSIVIHSK